MLQGACQLIVIIIELNCQQNYAKLDFMNIHMQNISLLVFEKKIILTPGL